MELIGSLFALIGERVHGPSGPALVREAVAGLSSPDPATRELAQILLAQANSEEIPEALLLEARESEDPLLQVWAAFWEIANPAAELRVEDDPTLYRRGLQVDEDPIEALSDELRALLVVQDLEGKQEEYREAYARVYLPNLERLGEWFPTAERYWLDIDGDGVDECLAFGVLPDGWEDQEVTLMVARGPDGQGWGVRYLRKWDVIESPADARAPFLVADLDSDGSPELVERVWVAAGYVWQELYVHDGADPEPSYFKNAQAGLIRLPGAAGAYAYSTSTFNESYSGKALSLVTALGESVRATRLGLGEPRTIEVIVRRRYR
jgi:hypothetical protein